MTDRQELSLAERRTRLERRANVLRSRLLRTVDAIDTRRRQITEIGHHAKRLVVPAAATLAGVAVLAAFAGLTIRALIRRRREHRLGHRVSHAIARLRPEPRRATFGASMRRLLAASLTLAVTEAIKRGLLGVFEGRAPLRRLTAGHER
ncbi:MAG: hypothetical protein KF819_26180 [Labilithrix sp.]|nr:hypothetical protein [Labilithrix sp.]